MSRIHMARLFRPQAITKVPNLFFDRQHMIDMLPHKKKDYTSFEDTFHAERNLAI